MRRSGRCRAQRHASATEAFSAAPTWTVRGLSRIGAFAKRKQAGIVWLGPRARRGRGRLARG
eukprot:828847-Lingulodinium_polyedra.AAC.1